MPSYIEDLRSCVGSRCLFVPGVRAILMNELGEVLLQQRTDSDLWGLPGGAVELDESALEALHREVWEETGLEVLEAEAVALYSGPGQRFHHPNGDEVQPFALAFLVRRWDGQPRADGIEGSVVRFWPLDALPSRMVPIHADTLEDFRTHGGGFHLG